MTSELKLYHYWRSSCSWRVRWALNIKNVPYEAIAINLLKGEQKEENYLKMNPAAFVPALSVDGKFFGESMAMIEWIEEAFPTPSLLPTDLLDRMHVRQLYNTISSGTQPLQNLAAQKYFSDDKEEKLKYAQHWISRGLQVYENLLNETEESTYSCGENITMADLALVPQVYNAERFNVDMDQYPRIKSINERCLATNTCQKAHPQNQAGAL